MKYAALAGFVSVWTLAAQSQGSIEGQILNASTGAPVKKATVRLSVLNSPGGLAPMAKQGGRGAAPALNADTDAEGRFQFTGLPPGRYNLIAQRVGFVQQNYGARRAGGPGTPIVLGQDQHMRDAVFRLTPQGTISGRVLDEDGDPVPYSGITVFRQAYQNGKRHWQQTNGGSTVDTGEFRVAGLEPGRYILLTIYRPAPVNNRFGADGSLPAKPELTYPAIYYPNVFNEQSATPVDVGPGADIRGIDIHITRVPSFHLRGTVNGIPAGPAGRGGVMVTLFPKDGVFNPTANTQVTAGENQFDLRGVVPGEYTLAARWGGGPTQLLASQPIAVGSGHVTGVTLTLEPPFDLAGQVSVAESGNQISLKNVSVNLRPIGMFLAGTVSANSDTDGRLAFKNVAVAHYAVDVQNPPDGCYVDKVKYAGQEVGENGVDFAVPAPLEVVLSNTAGKISGSVMDKDGKPVPQATVALIASDGVRPPVSRTSDENGSFTFDRLRPGTYKLLSWEDVEAGAWQDPEFRKPYDGRATEIKLGPSEQPTTQLKVIAVEEMAGHR